MDIIQFNTMAEGLPIKVSLSFEKLILELEAYAKNNNHPLSQSAKLILEEVAQFPELKTGIEDPAQLEKFDKAINLITEPLFPKPLQSNEIKAIMLPFNYIAFRATERLRNIMKNAGDDFVPVFNDFNDTNFFYMACSIILGKYYNRPLDLTRPIFLEIPDKRSGIKRQYRVLLNADFAEVIKTDAAPELTDEDINELLLNGLDLDLWKSKFPEDSYVLKGFTMLNLYDATLDITISKIRSLFLRNDDGLFKDFEENLRTMFSIKDLQVGFSVYNTKSQQVIGSFLHKESSSLFANCSEACNYQYDEGMFCEGIGQYVMQEAETFAIPNIELYGKRTGKNLFYQTLHDKKIQSIILAPIRLDNGLLQVLEIASTRPNELNALNATKLQDILPFMKIAAERYFTEAENLLESTIQENYTSIHPTVRWRFNKAANNFNRQKRSGVETPFLEDIVFENIYPLYGQSDIKGSSTARNHAIQVDLEMQLLLVIETFEKIMDIRPLPIFKKLIFRVKSFLESVKGGLNAGDEVSILDFLKHEIYPVFNHVKTLGPAFQKPIKEYMSHIDPSLNVVYKERKAYEDSVTILNEKLSGVLDQSQEEAQAMFPHYFQRFNTDGVEYNLYIGDSLLENKGFDLMYLHNLRLWQLETMWKIEQKAYRLVGEMPYPLEVASLILVHSNPLAIKFMMDSKQFDVDGAYNARYEIIKKRIDKSHIKGTEDRVTVPGKIAIIYSQDKDAEEYIRYIEYLQAEGKFGEMEMLEIEDLQGVSGLKAIRVEVLYKEKEEKKEKAKLNGKRAALVEA